MDLFLLESSLFIGRLFLPMWIVGIALTLVGVYRRRKDEANRALFFIKSVAVLVACYIALSFGITTALEHVAADKLYAMTTQNTLRVHDGSRVQDISDPARIAAFIGIIRDAPGVSAHHRHPLGGIRFDFPATVIDSSRNGFYESPRYGVYREAVEFVPCNPTGFHSVIAGSGGAR